MKGKTKTYILIVAFLGIWGTIGYKIVSAMIPEKPKTNLVDNTTKFMPKATKEIDTFSIQSLERDPFLGSFKIKGTNKPEKVSSITNKSDSIYVPVQYYGMLSNQNSNDKVYVSMKDFPLILTLLLISSIILAISNANSNRYSI